MQNESKNLIKSTRKAYEGKIAEECKNNPKSFWKYVQERTKVNTGTNTLKTGKGGLAESDMEKAEALNEYFASVFAIEDKTNTPDFYDGSKSNGISVTDMIITPAAVEKKLHELNQFKAQGPDLIPPKVLKELSKEIAIPLSKIFNKSLETGKIPYDWKSAEVTAIFKKGSKSEPGNYRPVSLTCIACKVLESLIRDVIVSHFTDNVLALLRFCIWPFEWAPTRDKNGFKRAPSPLLWKTERWTKVTPEYYPSDTFLRPWIVYVWREIVDQNQSLTIPA